MGLAFEDFLKLTPFEYKQAYKYWLKHNEHQQRTDWERARWMVYKNLTPPKKPQISLIDLIEFPWEKELKKLTMSSEQRFKQLKEKWHE